MINVRAIANRRIQLVNANIPATLLKSTGYTTNDAGHRVPTFSRVPVTIQNQAASNEDLKQTDGLNLQGTLRTVSIAGDLQGTIRAGNAGGDLLQFPDSTGTNRQWLVTQVLETWPTWCRVLVVMQTSAVVDQYPEGSLLIDGLGLLVDGLNIIFSESAGPENGSLLIDGDSLLIDGLNLIISDGGGVVPNGSLLMDGDALLIDSQQLIIT